MPSRILTPAKAHETAATVTQSAPFTVEPTTTYNTALTAISSLAGFVQDESAAATNSPQPNATNGVFLIERGEGSLVEIQFYGSDTANQTFTARIEGWSQYKLRGSGGMAADVLQWEPTVLATVAVTLGASTGVSGGLVTATQLWADTLVVTGRGLPTSGAGVAGPSVADDGKVTLVVDPMAHQLLVVRLTRNGGTAVSAGLAYRWLTGV